MCDDCRPELILVHCQPSGSLIELGVDNILFSEKIQISFMITFI